MDAIEREAKINFLNWYGKVIGIFTLVVGDVPVWTHCRDTIDLTDDELDCLFTACYDKCEANSTYRKLDRKWDEVCGDILGAKVTDRARNYRAAMIEGVELKRVDTGEN